jgi:hypothetical protein
MQLVKTIEQEKGKGRICTVTNHPSSTDIAPCSRFSTLKPKKGVKLMVNDGMALAISNSPAFMICNAGKSYNLYDLHYSLQVS